MNLKSLLDTFDDDYHIFVKESVDGNDLFSGYYFNSVPITPYLNRRVDNIILDLWEEDIVIVVSKNDFI